jgi:uncharacterized protein YyaL (SSP411 family)
MRRADGGLYRTARAGKVHLDAYLEDYAFLADALIDLYEAGGSADYLAHALRIAERMIADFADDESGAFFHTAHDHERLVVRTREGHDGAIPAPNAVAARACARLSFHLDRLDLRERALRAVHAYGKYIERTPDAFTTILAVIDLLERGPVELALVGKPGEEDYEALRRAVAALYIPNRITAHLDPERQSPEDESQAAAQPLLQGKMLVDGKAALYVCRDFTCAAPVTDPEAVGEALRDARDAPTN